METNHKLINVGNYVLTNRKLGEGSFSKVKVAHHKVLQKEVAMKIIKKSSIKDPYVAKNLEREAQILSTLNHINVVRLFEIVQCEGLYCIIMEFFPGGSVCDLVQSRGKLNEVISRRFFSQMITGLSYIHKMVIKNLVYALSMSCLCPVYVLSMSCLCFVYVLSLSCLCLVYVLSMSCLCLVYVLSMSCLCLVYRRRIERQTDRQTMKLL